MKKLFKYLIEHIGEFLLLLGSFFTAIGIFSFNDRRHCFGLNCDDFRMYYYPQEIRFLIGVSVVLIIIGILVIRNKNK